MKKYLESILLLFVGVVILTACSEDSDDKEYNWATVSGEQVYFNKDLASVYEISPNENNFTITLNRVQTSDAITVPVQLTTNEGSIFTLPNNNVSFEKDSATATLTLTYDPTKIEFGKYDTLTVSIADQSMTTPYGASSYTFQAGATAWVDYGVGQIRDGLVASLYDGLDVQVYNVKVMKNVVEEGLYRFVCPYGAGTPYAKQFDGEGLETDIEIDASDPNFVYFKYFDSGVTISEGDGELSFLTFVEYYLSKGKTLDEVKAGHPEYFAQLKDGLIEFSTPQSCLATIGGEGYYYANGAGLLAFALPGTVIKDYTLGFSQSGRFINVDNEELLTATITTGPDVETVKYAIAPISEDGEAIIAGIIDGSVEAESVGSGESAIQLQFEKSGNYFMYIVAFAEGEVVGQGIYPISYNSVFETWTAVGTGKYTYTVVDLTADEEAGEEGYGGVFDDLGTVPGTIFQSNDDASRFKIVPWALNTTDGLVFTVEEDKSLTVFNCYTGLTDKDYGAIYATDIQTYGLAQVASGAQDGTFVFYMTYHNDEDWLAAVVDVFELSSVTDESRSLPSIFKVGKKTPAYKKPFAPLKKDSAKKKLFIAKD